MIFSTACRNDESLGPGVLGCRDEFDFTIFFELVFFGLLPAGVFVPLALWRAAWLARKPVVVQAPYLQVAKLIATTLYIGLHLALVVLTAIRSFTVSNLFIASSALQLIAGLCLLPASFFEHERSPRPSMLLSSYLSLTLLFNIAEARTFWLSSTTSATTAFTTVFTTSVALKSILLLLESRPKTKWVTWDTKEPHSPEETAGIFGLGVYFWLNRLFLKGYGSNLAIDDLYPLDHALKAKPLQENFQRRLDFDRLKGDKFGLIKLLCRSFPGPLLLPVIPRLFQLAFTFCQPFFIQSLLHFLSQDESLVSINHGYGLIGASVLIYSGIAVSTAIYQYLHHRALQILRGCLATALYATATDIRADADQDSASLTLMSTDLERIRTGLRNIHDIWAGVIEVSIASWLLYNQLGLAFLAPIVLVLLCFFATFYMARFVGPSQKSWMARVQQRVGLTSSVIASMKSLKITGVTEPVGTFLQDQRVGELEAGSRFRRFIIYTATLAHAPFFLAPAFAFAASSRSLDTVRIFTSFSWLSLLTAPLSTLFQTIPQILAAVACLQRIQAFLELEPRKDSRKSMADPFVRPGSNIVEKSNGPRSEPTALPAINVRDGQFGWEADKMVLKDITFGVARSSFTIVCGPVASGKSTLCKALLGEIPFQRGSIELGVPVSNVSYCDQTPFLSNDTIKHNIIGFSPFNAERYFDVVGATMLNTDLQGMPAADQTVIGSNGITLSGGQKQRVALARALYLNADLLIFDDVFSGLDADTEEQVFRRVFGPGGLLRRRGATCLLCTHSVRHLPAADHIIALGPDGSVVEQGDFGALMQNDSYVASLGVRQSGTEAAVDGEQDSAPASGSALAGLSKQAASPASAMSDPKDTSRRFGDSKIYGVYAKAMGYWLVAFVLVIALVLGFMANFSTIWLKYWSADVEAATPQHSFAYWVGIYFLLATGPLLSLAGLGIGILQVSVSKSGASLHQGILRTLMTAPLRFFTTTDQGEILNLFSQDMNLVDTELPIALLNVVYGVFVSLGHAAVLATASVYVTITYPFLFALLALVARFYLRTSRQMRLLDLEAKSPLYTHFLDTAKGIITARAFGFLAEDRDKNTRLVDTSQRPAYLLQMIQNWLSLVLGLLVMGMCTVLTTLTIKFRSSSGFAGASMVTLMGLGSELTYLVLYLTQLETSLGAISRCKTFTDTVSPEDTPEETVEPPQDWPQQGVITLDGVSASYRCVRGCCMVIKPRH
jgi:ABC-type multidrug transport system fused ATPase/permease subunit